MKKQILSILVLAVLLTGCAHTTRTDSYLAPDLPPDTLNRAADDLTVFLTTIYPPGQTVLNISPNESAFHELLENSLRAKGFEIAAPPSTAGQRLSCVIDTLEDGESCYLRAMLADGQIYSKVYFIHDNGLLKGTAAHGQKADASVFQKTSH